MEMTGIRSQARRERHRGARLYASAKEAMAAHQHHRSGQLQPWLPATLTTTLLVPTRALALAPAHVLVHSLALAHDLIMPCS